jgi:hypothetical protein
MVVVMRVMNWFMVVYVMSNYSIKLMLQVIFIIRQKLLDVIIISKDVCCDNKFSLNSI